MSLLNNELRIIKGTVEYEENPLGVECLKPVFGWEIYSKNKGMEQSSYEILVSKSRKELENGQKQIWNSGKTASTNSYEVIYGGEKIEEQTVYYWKVRVWDQADIPSDFSETYRFETGILSGSWIGKWIGRVNQGDSLPVFRKEFNCQDKVKRARIYACGVGQYELYLNGKKVGDDVLEPAWTDYNKYLCYAVYDVTQSLRSGNNALAMMLGNGFYNIEGKRYAKYTGSIGKIGFILQLAMEYENGTKEVIGSDDSFHSADGPITYSCVYGGEDYDARKDKAGYQMTGYTEGEEWKSADYITAPKGKLIHRAGPPLRIKKTYTPIKIEKIGESKYLCDFGTNFSGWTSISVSGKRGTQVKIIPGELLDEKGFINQHFTGGPHFYLYTLKGEGIERFTPRFTFYGFRYVQIEGASPKEFHQTREEVILHEIKGEMIYPEIREYGSFSCSCELWNQIHQIIRQSMLSNIKSVLTDCPHREKLGWLEETHLLGPSLMYNFDMHKIYRKLMLDIEHSQTDEGLVPSISPEYVVFEQGFRDSPEWGSACVINPWYIYKYYGDREILKRYYPVMQRYVNYLNIKAEHHILHHGLGDWCDFGINPPFAQNTPIPVTATAIYYYDLLIMEKTAYVLGKEDDGKIYREEAVNVKEAFNREFLDRQGQRYVNGSQAANAMGLFLGLGEKEYEEGIKDCLVHDIQIRENHTTGGDVGYPFILRALTKCQRNDVISDMLIRTDNPSYGFQVLHGATALCEEWDGNMPGKEKNSQNHFMLGGIEEWLYGSLAGIHSVHKEEDGRWIVIEPYLDEKIDWVEAASAFSQGEVKIKWIKENDKIRIHIKIPANTKGKLILSDTWKDQILKDGDIVRTEEMEMMQDSKIAINFQNGSTIFTVNMLKNEIKKNEVHLI